MSIFDEMSAIADDAAVFFAAIPCAHTHGQTTGAAGAADAPPILPLELGRGFRVAPAFAE